MTPWIARALLILASVVLTVILRPLALFGPAGEAPFRNAIAGVLFAMFVLAAARVTRSRDGAGAAGALVGMLAGALLAAMIGRVVSDTTPFSAAEVRAFATLAFVYIGGAIGLRAARAFVAPGPVALRGAPERAPAASGSPAVLDSSSIIDGRVAGLATTGFLDGAILVPGFILREVQHIADSQDPLRRARGRRGLEVLEQLKTIPTLGLSFPEDTIPEAVTVDDKLVELALRTGARLVTTDFNLNKVATLRGVRVLNVNDLASALRPTLLPGDGLRVALVREGKEPGQGLGYLDDGTMVVVEQGREAIGAEVEVVVTNALQTSAGRMIFAKITGR